MGHELRVIPGEWSACRLAPDASLPSWARGGRFTSVTWTTDELSILCESGRVRADEAGKVEPGFRVLQVRGPFSFETTGVMASLAQPLLRANVAFLAVATFDTDYLLLKDARLEEGIRALTAAGHTVARG